MSEQSSGMVHGKVAPGYERVRAVFEANFASGAEVGASFAVYRDGRALVDLWGGYADLQQSRPVDERTLFAVWSTSKGLAALCVALLVERGALKYEQPVSTVWPEFAANGKDAITVAQLLSHQAGLVGTREPATISDYYEHARVAELLAGQAPFFEPGKWGYHTLTFGTLADELVRRVDGRTLGRFFAEEVADPHGIDAYLGLPLEEDARQAEMTGAADADALGFDPGDPACAEAALLNPLLDWAWPNQRAWREAGVPGAGGSASARGLARLYGLLVAPESPILSPAVLEQAIRERIAGVDQSSGGTGRYAAGFRLNTGSMGSNPAAFGHAGMGGSVGFADPHRRLGIGYTPNRMTNYTWQASDPRLTPLLAALYGIEGAR